MKNLTLILKILFVVVCLIGTVIFIKKITDTNKKIQLTENSVRVTNHYYFLVENREHGDLLGDITVFETILNKTLRKNKNNTFDVERTYNQKYYYNDGDLLFLVPQKTYNNYIDKTYSIDIFVDDPEQLKEYYYGLGFLSYEAIKIEAYIEICGNDGKYNTLGELNNVVNGILCDKMGVSINIIKK